MKTHHAIRVSVVYLFAALAEQAPAQSFGHLTGEVTGGPQTVDSRWSVELRPLNEARSQPPDRIFLQPGGRFHATGVRPGSYELTVMDPEQREVKREVVSVGSLGTSEIQIRLASPFASGSPAGGLVSLRRLAHKVPKPARKEFERARHARERERHDEAETHYQRALDLDPEFLEAANDLGALYYRLSRFHDSLRTLERARAIDPDSAFVLANLAATMMALHRASEAEPLARRALALDSTSVRVRYLFALSRAATRRIDAEARTMLSEVSSTIPHAHLALAQMCLAEGDRQGARAELERYLAATRSRQPGPGRADAERWLNSLR